MPVEIKVKPFKFYLEDYWIDEEDFKEMKKRKTFREDMKELLNEDQLGFLDSIGGLKGLIDNMEFKWKKKKEESN